MALTKLIDTYHNEAIDWHALKAAGYAGAYIKATDGQHTVDPKWAASVAAAQSVGIERGVFHFLEPDSPAQAQADLFLSTVGGKTGLLGMLPPALDVEGDLHNHLPPDDNGAYALKAVRWLQIVEEAVGVKPVVYTYPSFITEHLLSQLPTLTKYPLWISSIEPHQPGQPASVAGWGTDWTFHQYTTTGSVAGASDLDVFNGDLQALQALLLGAGQTVSVIRHSTGEVVAQYMVVPKGNHIADDGKLYVQ